MTDFGERLRRARTAAGMSQRDLAGDDLSPSYVSRLEAGERTPRPEVVRSLAARLGCTAEELLSDAPSERARRLDLELAYGRLAVEHGEAVSARDRLARLLAEPDLPTPVRQRGGYLLGVAHERLGDLHAAADAWWDLLDPALAGRCALPVTEVAVALCGCYLSAGDLDRAVSVGERALEAARAQDLTGTEDYFRLAATVMSAQVGLGNYLHASVWADRLLVEARAAGERGGQAALYWNAAVVAEQEGRLDRALVLCERAMAHLSEVDDGREYTRLLVAVADVLLACSPPRLDRARDVLARAGERVRTLCGAGDVAEWGYLQATVLLHDGDPDGALPVAEESVALLSGAAPGSRVRALVVLADVLDALGRSGEAEDARHRARDVAGGLGGGREAAGHLREVADRWWAIGDHRAAADLYRTALAALGVRGRGGSPVTGAAAGSTAGAAVATAP